MALVSGDRISAAFLDAVTDPTGWDRAMDIAASETGSFGATLIPLVGRETRLARSQSIQGLMDDYVQNSWHQKDARDRGIPNMMRNGVTGEIDFISIEKITKNEYYQDFLIPHNAAWFAGIKIIAGSELWCLALQRPWGAGPFTRSELAELAKLSPRLSAAASLAVSFESAKAKSALAAFDTMSMAAAAIDRNGSVLEVNFSFERLIRFGIGVKKRRLFSSFQCETDELYAKAYSLIRSSETRGNVSTPVLLKSHSFYDRPIVALAIRHSPINSDRLGGCPLTFVFKNANEMQPTSQTALTSIFGLTRSEEIIAIHLYNGHGVRRISDIENISYETARNHLKSIYLKIGIGRQAELLSVLSKILPLPTSPPPP